MKRCNLLFLLSVLSSPLFGQNSIGLKFFGLSAHPKGDQNASLMPRRFDSKGVLVLNIGATLSYEHFVYKDIFSLKTVQGLYSDCAARLGGFSHIGFRAKIFRTEKHALYTGMGPTVIFRRNWSELKGYSNLSRFKGSEDVEFQHLFLWYGGEFEYNYVLNEHIDLSATFIPGYPDLLSLSFGIRFKFPKKKPQAQAPSHPGGR